MKKHLVPTVVCAALGIAGIAHGDVLFFLDEGEFQAALQQAGMTKKGFEDFPWLAPPNSVVGTSTPVDVNGSQPGWYVPGMLIDNLAFQPNQGGADSSQTTPPQPSGIALFTQGFLDLPANGLVSSVFVTAFDIVSTGDPGHTAMGMLTTTFLGGNSIRVDVYDSNNVLIGNMAAAPTGPNGAFLGILATGGDTIGRVNFFDAANGVEGLFNIAVYIPAPGSLALLGLAGLVRTRRRRA